MTLGLDDDSFTEITGNVWPSPTIDQYAQATGDYDFMRDEGLEMLVATSREQNIGQRIGKSSWLGETLVSAFSGEVQALNTPNMPP